MRPSCDAMNRPTPRFGSLLLWCSLISVCTSDAFSSSSSPSFIPRHTLRSHIPRGGGNGNDEETTTTKCVLNMPRASATANGFNGEEHQPQANGVNKRFKKNGFTSPLNVNGGATPMRDRLAAAEYVAETRLPTDIGHFTLRAYRTEQLNEFVGTEPCVIYSPAKSPFGTDGKLKYDVPVRIHDQCMTSEVFRSQRCDCKEQLKMSLQYIQEHGGAVIYLQQEGRGIGLANKVAAYALQDNGLDTVDANLHLGFPDDAREYGVVPSILEDMGIGSIRLMTNNPRKVARLCSLGIKVVDTVPMVVPKANQHNRKYLEVKMDRMNHSNLQTIVGSMPRRVDADAASAEEAKQAMDDALDANTINAMQVDVLEDEELEISSSGSEMEEFSAEDEEQAGVTASTDGYCFGRQSVEDAVAAVARGEMVVVVDDMDRENEGDLIMAADLCTPEDMAKIVRYSSGVICIAMRGSRMDELGLPAMCTNNEDPKGTAFSVTVDATKEHGITTGISATDRAKTVNLLATPGAKPTDFARPGHIFPLRARDGGVLERDGHTEAGVDLSVLAGRHPSGILCEIVSEENPVEMARLPELKRFAKAHGMVLTSIVDIAQYRRDLEAETGKSI